MSQDNDRQFLDLVYQAIVPIGHRPTKPDDIEAMLRTCDEPPMNDAKLERMLKKVKGELPIGSRSTATEHEWSVFERSLTEEQRELVALHRAKGTELPADIQALLEKLRMEAKHRTQLPPPDGGK